MTAKPAFRPTRMCPHRLCKPVHIALAVVGLCFASQIMFQSLAGALFLAILGVIGLKVARLIHGKSLHQQVLDEAVTAASETVLLVRQGWANVAVGCDLLFLLLGSLAVAQLFRDTGGVNVPALDAAGMLALAVAIAIPAFSEFAHRQATRPAKTKRVLVPVTES